MFDHYKDGQLGGLHLVHLTSLCYSTPHLHISMVNNLKNNRTLEHYQFGGVDSDDQVRANKRPFTQSSLSSRVNLRAICCCMDRRRPLVKRNEDWHWGPRGDIMCFCNTVPRWRPNMFVNGPIWFCVTRLSWLFLIEHNHNQQPSPPHTKLFVNHKRTTFVVCGRRLKTKELLKLLFFLLDFSFDLCPVSPTTMLPAIFYYLYV